jgi:hypothetical protein
MINELAITTYVPIHVPQSPCAMIPLKKTKV